MSTDRPARADSSISTPSEFQPALGVFFLVFRIVERDEVIAGDPGQDEVEVVLGQLSDRAVDLLFAFGRIGVEDPRQMQPDGPGLG